MGNAGFRRGVGAAWLALAGMLAAGTLAAQSGEGSAGTPHHQGRGKVTEAVGQKGAILDIGQGITLHLPPGLPIGSSRVLTFRKAKRNVRPPIEGFSRVGPTLRFDGALSARSNPITLSIRTSKVRPKPKHRLVLAVEQAGLCTEENKQHKLPNGLCSTWETAAASHDGTGLTAELETTGGYRLQFGWMPETAQ